MSKIIRFPLERTKPDSKTLPGLKADIVIFPGVRIERREFKLADRHGKTKSAFRTKTTAIDA